jgi:hypothetical protein
MFETQHEYKLSKDPIIERLQPQRPAEETEQSEPPAASGVFRIKRYENEEAVGWRIEVDHERAKLLDDVFDDFGQFLTRLARAG